MAKPLVPFISYSGDGAIFSSEDRLVRYFFDIMDNQRTITSDDEGMELPTVERACGEAVRILAEIVLDEAKSLPSGPAEWRCTIRSANGRRFTKRLLVEDVAE